MKLLYILGNGFDLNAGLHTDYHSFYEYYVKQKSNEDCIVRMKKAIELDKDATWADLEEGLGRFSRQCTKEEFISCIADIKTELRKYLHQQTDGKTLSGLRYEDLLHPDSVLETVQVRNYESLNKGGVFDSDQVNVISLNYTDTFEQLIDVKTKDNESDYNVSLNGSFTLKKIVHLHGLLDNEMNMGVNDPSQIENKDIVDSDVIEEFVKPEYNDSAMNRNNELAEELINSANVIVIFGSSLGNTDKKWWKLIGQNIENGHCGLIYFVRDTNRDMARHPNYKRRWIKESLGYLKRQMDLPQEIESYMKSIFVGLNKNLFSTVKIQEVAGIESGRD